MLIFVFINQNTDNLHKGGQWMILIFTHFVN